MPTASEIANRFGLEFRGKDIDVYFPQNEAGSLSNGIGWAKNRNYLHSTGVIVIPKHLETVAEGTVILCDNPRLEFSRIVAHYWPRIKGEIHIGENCTIHPLATIGTNGMGYEWSGKEWIEFPQIGGVSIEANVTIGPHSDIKRAALGYTVIGAGTKIGSHCNIGHGVRIGECCMVTQGVSIAGSATLGKNVYIATNATIRNKVKIADNVFIGQGANVVKDITEPGVTVIGNPAHVKREVKQ